MLMAEALKRLTGSSRTVVELALVDRLTGGEMAERTSLPLATSMVRSIGASHVFVVR
jgi:DNA-directed RNA polymerase specialized sigma24 family protein